ncbi:MAG: hypothetical protein FJY86_04025 [Candidatus Diapherotrites archaeon]|uniref:DUF3368 domain-containing protein n=1 Tax=Candidatus Iainarchaeum sp. TaxID=3101447 RepID=A0A8T4C7G6_9ARCH|nr:hypothetical protein [Candidatus Diapherotrites archaeon]
MTKSLVISDSSSLILITKAGLLSIVCKDFRVEIPEKVYEETVIAGKELQRVDAFKIDEAIQSDSIKVKKIKPDTTSKMSSQLDEFNLGDGEKEAILLYQQENALVLLIDDRQGIKMAKLLNINWTTTPKLIVGLTKTSRISKRNGLEALRVVQLQGRYSLDFILDAMDEIEKTKEVK